LPTGFPDSYSAREGSQHGVAAVGDKTNQSHSLPAAHSLLDGRKRLGARGEGPGARAPRARDGDVHAADVGQEADAGAGAARAHAGEDDDVRLAALRARARALLPCPKLAHTCSCQLYLTHTRSWAAALMASLAMTRGTLVTLLMGRWPDGARILQQKLGFWHAWEHTHMSVYQGKHATHSSDRLNSVLRKAASL